MEENQSGQSPKKEKPYESIEDWYQEVRHLKWPVILFLILVLVLIILIDL